MFYACKACCLSWAWLIQNSSFFFSERAVHTRYLSGELRYERWRGIGY